MTDDLQHVFYKECTMESPMVNRGLAFIRRRFSEVWNIFRSDVDYDRIFNRSNVVSTRNGRITGWLGLETDGELTNACIEKGQHGVLLLEHLIRDIYAYTDNEYYYAETPIVKSGSARAFLMTGMHLAHHLQIHTLYYPEKKVDLIRLEIYRSANPKFIITPPGIEDTLAIIRETANHGSAVK